MIPIATLMVCFLALFAAGIPVAVSLGLVSIVALLLKGDVSPSLIAIQMVSQIDQWPWLAIPLFVLAGNLMNFGGLTERLVNAAKAVVGHIPGALSHVTVVTNAVMSGMSGSMLADAAAIGTVLIPAMKKEGYSPGYASGIVAASSVLGPLIPPSIAFIIYGTLANVSVARLFISGVVPGVLVAVILLASGYAISVARNYPRYPRSSFRQMTKSVWFAAPGLLLPVVIIGSMRAGMFTATEASAIAVVYALLVSGPILRQLKWPFVVQAFRDTIKTSAALLFIIAAGGAFAVVSMVYQLEPLMAKFATSVASSPLAFMFFTVVFLFILGCFLEGVAILIIFVPLMSGIARAFHIDPVQYGAVFVMATLMSALTPPFATAMFLTNRIAGCGVSDYAKESWPFIALILLCIVPFVLVPGMATWLPNLVLGP